MQYRMRILAAALICAVTPFGLAGQKSLLRVGISPFAPFVLPTQTDQRPAGYSVDLWHALAQELGVEYDYVSCAGVAEKLRLLEEGLIDVAIGGITITRAREKRVDFSHPYYHTGLDILVPARRGAAFTSTLRQFVTRNKMIVLGGFLLLIVVFGHLVWLVERGQGMFSDRYLPGVFEGMYWAIVTASTVGYGDKAPLKSIGRILAIVVIVTSLPLFAVFTAELASTFTVREIRSDISGPENLAGRRVGTVAGTTSAEFVGSLRTRLYSYATAAEAYHALVNGELDAVVYDAPNLRYYVQHEGRGRAALVGKIFRPQDLGMAVQLENPLRQHINLALLGLLENEQMATIQEKWFGTP